MLKFYYNTGPNPMKVALCLEEMGLAYEPIPIDTRKGEQHSSSYLEINPNAKAPSIVDEGNVIFDSNAIVCGYRNWSLFWTSSTFSTHGS